MEVSIKRVLYLSGLVLLTALNDGWAGSCLLKEEHIKELALVVICAAVNTEPLLPLKKSYMVESGNDLGDEQEPPESLKQICRRGLSNIDGNHLFFRPDSRTTLMGAWVEPTTQPLPSYQPMVRELSRYCSGLDSLLSPVLFYDSPDSGYPQKRPNGAGLTETSLTDK